MPNRKASAVWEGGLRGGKGTFKNASGSISGNYSFGSRFETIIERHLHALKREPLGELARIYGVGFVADQVLPRQ